MGFAATTINKQSSFTQTEQSDDDDEVVPDPLVVQQKIKTAFSKIDEYVLLGVIQFWAPMIRNNGTRVLTNCNQPCAYRPSFSSYRNYKVFSEMFYYHIDDDDKYIKKESCVVLDKGAHITAFMNHLPEIVMDLTRVVREDDVHEWWRILRQALRCELSCYMMLPVFSYPCSSSCVGVVECFLEFPGQLPKYFTELRLALKGVGLSMFHVQESRPYKTLPCFNRTIYEIEQALEIICKSHDVTAAQVWIPYHVPFKSSFLEGTQAKQTFAVKLTGYCIDMDDDHILLDVKAYYDFCDVLPLENGEGLVGKALETYEPYFCRNIYELRANGMGRDMKPFETPIKCSSLVICMRSIDTGDIDYAFEFLWSSSRNYFILSESLLLTLKRSLPSFKLASGAELGDELRVFDVENSTGAGIGFFNLLEENRLSPIPEALEKRRRLVANDEGCISSSNVKWKATPIPSPQFGRSLNEPARNFTGRQRPNFVRGKLNDMSESESDSNDEEHQQHDRANQEILVIKVEYADDVFNLHLPVSLATIVAVKKEINEICDLNHGTYKLKYLDEDDEWILMNSDTHLGHCITSCRIAGGTHIRLLVLPLTH